MDRLSEAMTKNYQQLSLQSFPVLNLPVHLSDNYLDWLIDRVEHQQGTHVVTMNSEMAIMAQTDSSLQNVIKQADLVVPDGSGIVLYLWRRGKKQQRVAGIELAVSLVEKLAQQGIDYPICFYGGKSEVIDKAAQAWQQKYPNINLIYNHGFLSGKDLSVWQEKIKSRQPKLILVGLGVPRQEFWIAQHRHLAPDAVWIGVGGSFDIWAGVKSRAPEFMCNNNLEWLYRLYQEPWRWKRMMALPKFFVKAILD